MVKLTPASRLYILGFLALLSVLAFMTLGANGHWDFVLSFRAGKLAAMLLVAFAVAVSSVLFQTITHNRILTPSIMGFDALYTLIQAIVIFWFGLTTGSQWGMTGKFVFEVCVMTVFACLLFQWIFSGASHSLHLLLLVGIVFGLLFRSLSGLMVRMIDPNEFLFLQDKMFASFNSIRTNLLLASTVMVGLAAVIGWRLRQAYDVLSLGREVAINLGIHYRKTLWLTLVLIAVMVSVSTALVGPVTFFGLLVSNLAYMIMQTDRHKYTVPAAVLLGIIALVGGQTVLEHGLALNTTVSVVIEFAGGLMFIALIVRKGQR
ncbi:enterobactin ABC transporter permease [Advenella sp. S44]|uniref:iron chelate uptake ABC transporter family permease subunit n=1 Tax=Advenella sp. S44 TaxID=1982755 RepID=UPI000C2B1DBD|nr:iron chelate uptake ABC transporter family permease subunit [Advenella sp. S44]PJX28164.1 enterobactin ABC transporter permease [Advenella sp. S44]